MMVMLGIAVAESLLVWHQLNRFRHARNLEEVEKRVVSGIEGLNKEILLLQERAGLDSSLLPSQDVLRARLERAPQRRQP